MMQHQKGVVLVITFFIMTIIIAVALGISTILFNEVAMISNIGNSVIAFYAADSGIEKTLYFDRKQVSTGATRGFCNICIACNSRGQEANGMCNNCQAIPLVSDGCNVVNCNNCQINYQSVFGDKTYDVFATVDPANGLIITSQGSYKNAQSRLQSHQ